MLEPKNKDNFLLYVGAHINGCIFIFSLSFNFILSDMIKERGVVVVLIR